MHDLDVSLLEWAKVECKYTIRRPICDFLCVDNSNICHICHRLRDIHSQNLRTLDFDLSNGSVLCWLAVVSDCTGARIKNDTRHARHKQYTHTGIAYVHLIAPHTCDYMGYVRHVGHATRRSKNHMWVRGLEYAKFSLHEKWNNCPHPYRTVIV